MPKKFNPNAHLPEGAVEIRFNIEDPEAKRSAHSLMQMPELRSNLEEIYRMVRSKLKHGDTSYMKPEDVKLLEDVKALASIYLED